VENDKIHSMSGGKESGKEVRSGSITRSMDKKAGAEETLGITRNSGAKKKSVTPDVSKVHN